MEASHFHSDAVPNAPLSQPISKKTASSCLICNAFHTPALSGVATVFGIVVANITETIPPPRESATRLEDFGLFVRPPPNMA
jgi:hypothetical protein